MGLVLKPLLTGSFGVDGEEEGRGLRVGGGEGRLK